MTKNWRYTHHCIKCKIDTIFTGIRKNAEAGIKQAGFYCPQCGGVYVINVCQSCMTYRAQYKVENFPMQEKDNTFYVCASCFSALATHSLKPEEWKNLVEKNNHKDYAFLLHEDYYDEDGNALQPMYRKADWLSWWYDSNDD